MDAIPGPRFLIINGDDFGLTDGVTEGICRAFEAGALTSTSAIINIEGAPERIASAHARYPRLPIGLHLNISLGCPVLPPDQVPSLVNAHGHFYPLQELLTRLPAISRVELAAELNAQARLLRGIGVGFDHLDYHQMVVALYTPFYQSVRELARQYRVPVRLPVPESVYGRIRLPGGGGSRAAMRAMLGFGLRHPLLALRVMPRMMPAAYKRQAALLIEERIGTTNWFIDSYYQNASLENFLSILEQLPPGVSEVMAHPGLVDEDLREFGSEEYVEPRQLELDVLLDPRLPAKLKACSIQLVDFSHVSSKKLGH
jgi:predicted glycoside hydrolase/deacetylase ChbG (UPF0249 family)